MPNTNVNIYLCNFSQQGSNGLILTGKSKVKYLYFHTFYM